MRGYGKFTPPHKSPNFWFVMSLYINADKQTLYQKCVNSKINPNIHIKHVLKLLSKELELRWSNLSLIHHLERELQYCLRI